MRRNFLYLLFWCISFTTVGQTTVTLKRSGRLTLEEVDGRKVQKLIDDVWLVQENTNIYCDSAYLDKASNSARAFGNVRIIDTVDPLNIQGDYLEYNGNTRVAYLRNNVIMKDDSSTLYTDNLDYDRNTTIGHYFLGGKLIDATNELVSNEGYYNATTKLAEFYDSVRLENVDFRMATDTLYYNTITSQSETVGPTLGVAADGDSLITDTGLQYNRQKLYAEVYYGKVLGKAYDIEADTLITNDSIQYYSAFNNVIMTSKEDSLTIYGDKAYYDELNQTALVHENAYLRKMLEGDSLFIKGDTLYSDQSDPEQEYLTAYHSVSMYKSNMQGVADSITYNFSDSTIYMFYDPVIWSQNSQISADSIDILLANNQVHKMDLAVKSFVISKDSLNHFNQVSGRTMDVYFDDGYIDRTDVNGNGESIYYVQDESGAVSMNKLKCSDMSLFFNLNTVTEIRTYVEVDGQVIPEFEIKKTDERLRGFRWQIDRKPKLHEVARHLRYDR